VNETTQKRGLTINIHAFGMPFNGDTVKTKSLGGSESAAYYLARELAARGHNVNVWNNEKTDSQCDNVRYMHVGDVTKDSPLGSRFELYARNTPHDVLIVQRWPHAFHRQFAAKVCIWQLHDLALYRSSAQMMAGVWQCDAITCVSQWHADQVQKVWNINPAVLHVVPNGVDPALYADQIEGIVPVARSASIDKVGTFTVGEQKVVQLPEDKFIMLYQSRPERGLEHLVRPGGIMDRLRDTATELVVCGYDNTVPQMEQFYGQLEEWGRALPNVTFLGALTKLQLASLQQHCDLLCYPTEFEEVSCITAMEAMHAGLPMLTSECAALTETCKGSGTTLIPLKDGKADEDMFVARINTYASGDRSEWLEAAKDLQSVAARSRKWSDAADCLEDVIDKCFAKRNTTPAVLRHAIEHSDIDFARWVLDARSLPTDSADSVTENARQEVHRMYAFTESDATYEAHYKKHQTAYYDEHEQNVIGEDVTSSTRYRGVLSLLAEAKNEHRGHMRVLDYGCAHGHYSIPLAKTFADCDFVGVDISFRAIEAANKWKDKVGAKNAEFVTLGSDYWQQGQYEVIIAAEVLEHVRSQDEFLQQMRSLLAPGGCLIFTTPTGRWEWQGTEAFRTGREHLRLYERADIEDLCGADRHEIMQAPASHDRAGAALGSFVWAVWPTETFGSRKIDYERKLRNYAPRQTVSACLIVKDGEKTLRKCVESFVDFVDEVIICIDPTTRDRTLSIANELASDFPNRPFIIGTAERSAVRDGFDEARNESIAKASGDWILWCDADEELRHAERISMFLRPSMHNGFGFPQVHYSAEPDQVLTTDFPCRLFRNRQGIKFYGVVHEHPETEIGKAVTWSLVRHDMKFLHAGYVDERTRRARYERNLPLLMRDRKKFPNRDLNKFLMVRDIAQGLMFEQQQTGGQVMPWQRDQALEGIRIMEEMCARPDAPVRMIADAMQYYSHCVVTTGGGFDAEIDVKTKNDIAPDLAVSFNIKGRFHSRDFYTKLSHKLLQESTKLYEDRYL
jgi:2-polyprenyl-3-methyl-5-hydroxy-6-metoxy-1,4-benzoquinol methylase/glycosyltransferase involved in cell wall biosynthesis